MSWEKAATKLEKQIKQKLHAKRVSEREDVHFVAKTLAEIGHLPPSSVLKQIYPRNDDQLDDVSRLYDEIEDQPIEEMLDVPFFCRTFLSWEPKDYQLKFLRDQSPRIAVRWSRQSGKTTTFAVKSIIFCVTRPLSQSLITAPGLRQSMIVSDRIEERIYQMAEPARKAWILKPQRTIIRFHNQSRIKAMPYALHRLRGETSDLIFVDETAFIREDEELFQGVLMPQLATRWGKGAQLIASSTAWGRNNMFYRFCKDPKFSRRWSQHHVTWREPVKAGLIPLEFILEQEAELPSDRFKREWEVEFVEDEGRWLTQDLITSCISSDILEPWDFESSFQNLEFYIGADLGKKIDYSVIAVVEKVGDTLILRHVKVFPLGTEYGAVIGYIKVLTERWRTTVKVLADTTMEEHVKEDLEKVITEAEFEGATLSMQAKERYASYFKQKMLKKQFKMYYDPDLVTELNLECFQHAKDGHILFSHPTGTHDDVFWAICLATAAAMPEEEETKPYLAVIPR